MSFTFTFALSQNQTFELRCDYGARRLDTTALSRLIQLCEESYYSKDYDKLPELTKIGRELYSWLDGKEGWDTVGEILLNGYTLTNHVKIAV